MLSTDLAELYQVEPRALIQAVKRNRERFPPDFTFQLSATAVENLNSQIVISSWGGPRRATPHAFTEQGVAMCRPRMSSWPGSSTRSSRSTTSSSGRSSTPFEN
ncbi:MAG: ORF6N domain-containing protein [candidate division NC10 bacterium]